MTAQEFCEAGRRLYGPEWRKLLPVALRVSPVTLWRYANGLSPVPYTVELTMKAWEALGPPSITV
jgi:hypothetical protein